MNDNFEKQLKILEDEMKDIKNGNEADKTELLTRRVKDAVYSKFRNTLFLTLAIISVIIGLGGVKYISIIEQKLSNSISSQINETTKAKLNEFSDLASRKVDIEITSLINKFDDIEKRVRKAQFEVDKANIQAEIKLNAATKKVTETSQAFVKEAKSRQSEIKKMNQMLVKKVEKQHENIIKKLYDEKNIFEQNYLIAKSQTEAILDQVKNELQDLDDIMKVIRLSLSKKIDYLNNFSFDTKSRNADIQRHIAVLILKEMEDANLIARENIKAKSEQAVKNLIKKDGISDEFFTEVRFRIVNVIKELNLSTIACDQSLDPTTWDRDAFISLIGEIGKYDTIRTLIKIAENVQEPDKYRQKAIESLILVRKNNFKKFASISKPFKVHGTGVKLHGSELTDMYLDKLDVRILDYRNPGLIRNTHYYSPNLVLSNLISYDKNIDRNVKECLLPIVINKDEALILRKIALYALNVFKFHDNYSSLKSIIIEEGDDFGYDAIDILSGCCSTAGLKSHPEVIKEIIHNSDVKDTLKIKSLIGLAILGSDESKKILENFSNIDPANSICIIAKNLIDKLKSDEEIYGFATSGIGLGWLGINAAEIPQDMKEKIQNGALVFDVIENDPAFEAGIKENDIILSVNNTDIKCVQDLQYKIASIPAGQVVKIKIYRNGEIENFGSVQHSVSAYNIEVILSESEFIIQPTFKKYC